LARDKLLPGVLQGARHRLSMHWPSSALQNPSPAALRLAPAKVTGVTKRLWEIGDIVDVFKTNAGHNHPRAEYWPNSTQQIVACHKKSRFRVQSIRPGKTTLRPFLHEVPVLVLWKYQRVWSLGTSPMQD
jgi:hypothetical protein